MFEKENMDNKARDIVDIVHELVELAVSKLGIREGRIACNDESDRTLIFVGEVDYNVVPIGDDTVEIKPKPRKGIWLLLDKKISCEELRKRLAPLVEK